MARSSPAAPHRPSRLAGAAVMAAVLLLAGCGTTVGGTAAGTAATNGALGGGLAPAAGGAATSAPLAGAAQQPAAGSLGGAGDSRPAATSGVGPAPAVARVGSTAALPLGPGVTATTINVGIIYNTDYNQVAAASGASGAVTNDDARTVARAYIDDINKHGGVLGRRLNPVFAEFAINSAQTRSQQEQTICSTWTQDNKVFAAMAVSFATSRVLDACLTKAHVTQVGGSDDLMDAVTQRDYPLQYLPSGVALDRLAPAYIDGLFTAGSLTGKSVIALLSEDSPFWRRNGKRIAAELKARGQHLTDEVYVNFGDSPTEAKAQLPAIQNAMLRFQSEGVTTILMNENVPDVYDVATVYADSQHWTPNWGVTSGTGVALEADNGSVPQDQQATTTEVGWLHQVDRGNRPDTPKGPGYAHCMAVLKNAGLAPSSDQAADGDAALCEQLSFLVAGLAAGGNPDPLAFQRGAQSLTAFPVATTYATAFPGGRHDGATTYRVTAYRTACSCFEFVTPARPM